MEGVSHNLISNTNQEQLFSEIYQIINIVTRINYIKDTSRLVSPFKRLSEFQKQDILLHTYRYSFINLSLKLSTV